MNVLLAKKGHTQILVNVIALVENGMFLTNVEGAKMMDRLGMMTILCARHLMVASIIVISAFASKRVIVASNRRVLRKHIVQKQQPWTINPLKFVAKEVLLSRAGFLGLVQNLA